MPYGAIKSHRKGAHKIAPGVKSKSLQADTPKFSAPLFEKKPKKEEKKKRKNQSLLDKLEAQRSGNMPVFANLTADFGKQIETIAAIPEVASVKKYKNPLRKSTRATLIASEVANMKNLLGLKEFGDANAALTSLKTALQAIKK